MARKKWLHYPQRIEETKEEEEDDKDVPLCVDAQNPLSLKKMSPYMFLHNIPYPRQRCPLMCCCTISLIYDKDVSLCVDAQYPLSMTKMSPCVLMHKIPYP